MHDDLFAQAVILAQLDARRPKQANLRRAVSSIYYAVFHYLIHESTCILFGTQHRQAPYRSVLGRAFSHNIMKQACVSFGGGSLKAAAIKGLPRDSDGLYRIPTAIVDLASTFVELQEKRHSADYDRTEQFTRNDVLTLLDDAQNRVAEFSDLELTDDKRFFLACLWAWKELTNR